MNREQAEGKLDQIKGDIKRKWGKLTNDEVEQFEGNVTQFYGTLKEKYGLSKEDAKMQVDKIKEAAQKKAA